MRCSTSAYSATAPFWTAARGVPRIGGQKEDYVRLTLHGFKSGKQPGYTRAVTEALNPVPVEELDLLACLIANFTGK